MMRSILCSILWNVFICLVGVYSKLSSEFLSGLTCRTVSFSLKKNQNYMFENSCLLTQLSSFRNKLSRGTKFHTRFHVRVAKTLVSLRASAQVDQSLRCPPPPPPEEALDPWLLTVCPAKTDQTVRMIRLSRVFAGSTCNFPGNALPRLKL